MRRVNKWFNDVICNKKLLCKHYITANFFNIGHHCMINVNKGIVNLYYIIIINYSGNKINDKIIKHINVHL